MKSSSCTTEVPTDLIVTASKTAMTHQSVISLPLVQSEAPPMRSASRSLDQIQLIDSKNPDFLYCKV